MRPAKSEIGIGHETGVSQISTLMVVSAYEDFWVNDNGTYGIEDLFLDEAARDEREIENIILQRTKNKLYEIFVKTFASKRPSRLARKANRRVMGGGGTGALVTLGKRKLSPQPEFHQLNSTKTACCTPSGDTFKPRANSISVNLKTSKPKPRKRLYTASGKVDPRQQRLPALWRKNARSQDEL